MLKEGYKGITDLEARVYSIIGKRNFWNLIYGCFNTAYYEARYLHKSFRSDWFDERCRNNRKEGIMLSNDLITEYCKRGWELTEDTFDFSPMTPDRIIAHIRKKYRDTQK